MLHCLTIWPMFRHLTSQKRGYCDEIEYGSVFLVFSFGAFWHSKVPSSHASEALDKECPQSVRKVFKKLDVKLVYPTVSTELDHVLPFLFRFLIMNYYCRS